MLFTGARSLAGVDNDGNGEAQDVEKGGHT